MIWPFSIGKKYLQPFLKFRSLRLKQIRGRKVTLAKDTLKFSWNILYAIKGFWRCFPSRCLWKQQPIAIWRFILLSLQNSFKNGQRDLWLTHSSCFWMCVKYLSCPWQLCDYRHIILIQITIQFCPKLADSTRVQALIKVIFSRLLNKILAEFLSEKKRST